ncbi:MAG TPA: DUF1844 domain-containing protein [Acidobacteriaceae bacterium]|nr:DUF1844 domain-containing protein [Acidobacteriaceae bacterium]
MSEKPPVFTVTDRRKFTLEGELRDESAALEEAKTEPEAKKPEATDASKGPRLVTMPAPPAPAEPTPFPAPEAAKAPEKAPEPAPAKPEQKAEEQPVPELSAEDEAAARSAYQRSSDHIETLLRAANPAAGAPQAVTIEHVIQSIYLSAIVALGAATEPGQKPQIDLLGARQSIDMLGVLEEKTKGNLSEKEQRLLQNALFEVRMLFLEVTNAIAQQAQRPPQGKK